MRCAVLAMVLMLSACATPQRASAPASASAAVVVEPAPPVPLQWRSVAAPDDVERLAGIKEEWARALAESAARFRSAVAREGDLLRPDAALDRAMPPPGRYACRVVRIGGASAARAFQTYPSQYCFIGIDGDLTTFNKETGTQRPSGRLWEDRGDRLVFLGADGGPAPATAPPYGDDPARNLIGTLERIGTFRWRLVLPGATPDARLDIIELVPDLD